MKIANVIRRFVFDEWGGTESAVWNLSKQFSKSGHKPEILATSALDKNGVETRDGISIARYPYFYPHLMLGSKAKTVLDKKGGNPFSYGLYKHIRHGGFDIVHSHTLGRTAKISILAARKAGIPCVLSFHGGYADVPKSESDSMLEPTRHSLGYGAIIEGIFGIRKDAVAQSDGIICVGENEYGRVRKLFPKKPVALIPNGVDFGKFSAAAHSDFRKEHSIPKDRKLILCVSRIDMQKNQLALLDLLDVLVSNGGNAHLALVGFTTSETYRNKITEKARFLGLSDRLTICGGLPPNSDMLVSAYKSADVFALASIHEPFGIVVLEAWAAGVPVIAANVGGLGRLVRDGESGFLFNPHDPKQMAEAYANAVKFSSTIKSAAAKRCRENYSWESVAKRTLLFYNGLRK